MMLYTQRIYILGFPQSNAEFRQNHASLDVVLHLGVLLENIFYETTLFTSLKCYFLLSSYS